jgi:hypothetical protein
MMRHTPSLKSVVSELLAPAFNMTPAALYERQRALERAKLLKAEGGRGPGSGVRATPQAVAALLCSVLATDSLSEVETEAVVLSRLRAEGGVCPVTGKRTFSKALSALLAPSEMSAQALEITVRRGEKHAQIDFVAENLPANKIRSVFGSRLNSTRLLTIQASLQGFPLIKIAKLMDQKSSDPFPGYTEEEIAMLLGDEIAGLVECYRGE